MPYCSQCGVEVHRNTRVCPLCLTPVQDLVKDRHPERNYPDQEASPSKLPPLVLRERLRLARGISTIVFLIPMLFSSSINLFINHRITWSAYVILSLAGTLMITLSALFFPKKGETINLLTHLILSGVCYGFNGLTGWDSLWALKIAQPILAASWLIVALILLVARYKQGNLLAAAILTGTGLLCLAVDGILQLVLNGQITFGWSIIVASAVVPTAFLLLYLYSARFRRSRFRRFFHI